MAKRTEIRLIDDLDGTPAEETVTFGIDGVNYSIDLNKENAAKLRQDLSLYIAHAVKVGGRRRRGTGRTSTKETQQIREWAREQGMEVSSRGRIPAEIVAEYRASK